MYTLVNPFISLVTPFYYDNYYVEELIKENECFRKQLKRIQYNAGVIVGCCNIG